MSSRKSRLAATGTGGSEDTVEVTQKEKLSSSSSSSSAAASSSFDGRTSLLPSHLSAPAAFVQKEDFHLGKGMLVRAAYKKGKKYFRGTVHRVNANGTYDIMYNGGELEFKVERRFIDAVESRAEWKHRLHLRAMEEKKAKAIVDAALGKKKKQRQKNSPHDARPSGGGAATGGYDAKKLRSQSDAPFHRDSPLRSNLPWNCSVCRKPNNSTSENCRVCGTSKYYELAISKEKIMFKRGDRVQVQNLKGEIGAILNFKHGTVMSFNKKKGTFEVLLQLERDLAGASGKNKLTEAITVQSAFHPSNLKATGGVATVRELQLQISSPRFSKVDELTDSSVHELLAQYSAEKKKAKVAARVAKEKVALAKGEFEKRRSDVWVCVLCSRSNYWRLKKCRICKRPRVDVLHPPEEGKTTEPGPVGSPDASSQRLHRQQVAAIAAANAASSAGHAVSDTGDGSGETNNSSLSATTSSIDGVAPAIVLSEFDKKEWERRTEERIRDELEAEMKEQLHLLVNRYTRSKVEELDKLQEQLMAENQGLWNTNYTATTQAASLSRMLESQQNVLAMYQEKLDDAQIELQAREEQGIRLEKAFEVSQAEVKRLRRRVKELEDDKNHDEDSDSMADENIDGDVAEEGEEGDALRRQLLAQRQQRSERRKQRRQSDSERKTAGRGGTDADSPSNDGETSSALSVNTSRSRRGGKQRGGNSSSWDDSGDDAGETESDTSLRPQGYFTPMSSASKQQGMSPRWSPRVDFTRSPSSARLASATKNLADSLSRLKPVNSDSVGGGAGEAPRNHTEFTRYQQEQALLIENLEAKLVAMTKFVTTFKTATAVKRAAAKFKEGPENAAAAAAEAEAKAEAKENHTTAAQGFENEEKQHETIESSGSGTDDGHEAAKDSEVSVASPKSDSMDMSNESGREDEGSEGSVANSPKTSGQETGSGRNDSDEDDDDEAEEIIVDGVKDESGKPLSPVANARVVEVQ